MRKRLLAAAVFCCALPFALSCARAQSAAAPAPEKPAVQAPTYQSDPKFIQAMNEAKQLASHGRNEFVADAYRKANKIAGGQCFECLKAEYAAQMRTANFKGAAETAVTMEALADTPTGKSVAEYRHADALLAGGGEKPKPAQLEAVHGVLQEA